VSNYILLYRFSELYVGELTDSNELSVLVSDYLKGMCLTSKQIKDIVKFYIKIRKLAQTTLVDGLGKRPHYSLRTLCRALKISSLNLFGSVFRSLYESFCLSFLTQLDFDSHPIVEQLVAE
jgi:midasin